MDKDKELFLEAGFILVKIQREMNSIKDDPSEESFRRYYALLAASRTGITLLEDLAYCIEQKERR